MTRACAEAPATHFRLKPETWDLIAEEYKDGATARDLAAKWKVSPTTIYRYACRDGWTKKGMGDARARAHARMVEEEEAAHRSLNPVGSRALKGLFAPAPVDEPDAGRPEALAKAATLASGRAMRGRLWVEAKALAGLAESYARLATRARDRELTLDTIPLELLVEILTAPEQDYMHRLSFTLHPLEGEGSETRHAYWSARIDQNEALARREREEYERGREQGRVETLAEGRR